MPKAEILTIGTELLLGEILDSNAQYLALQLRDAGIDLFWTSTVGDNEKRIAEAVLLGLTRSDIVLCTGGLGPTVDDVTREAIALALEQELEFQEKLWEQIQGRFAHYDQEPSENNKRQAFVPKDARVLDNPNGTAPAFLVEKNEAVVIAMPGVPLEMSHIMENSVMPYLREHFGPSGVIRSRVLHTAGVGESLIDERISDLEKQDNPTVGMAAHAGAVDIRLTAKAKSSGEADAMLADLEKEVRERLENWVFGMDEETLANVIVSDLTKKGWLLCVVESGFDGALLKEFDGAGERITEGKQLQGILSEAETLKMAKEYAKESGADVCLLAALNADDAKIDLHIAFIFPGKEQQYRYSYGGAAGLAAKWASNVSLNLLRRQLLKVNSTQPG